MCLLAEEKQAKVRGNTSMHSLLLLIHNTQVVLSFFFSAFDYVFTGYIRVSFVTWLFVIHESCTDTCVMVSVRIMLS